MSLFEAFLMLAVILILSIAIAVVKSPRLKNWGVFAILTVLSIPPGAVIVNSVLTVLGL